MCRKIVTALSLLALCAAEPPQLEPHHHSQHAVSSQSYTRGDVPLSYKYSAVHIYTTPKPGQYKDHIPHHHYQESHHESHQEQPSYYQYAPIPTKSQSQELYTKVDSTPETSDDQVSYHGNGGKVEPQEQGYYAAPAHVQEHHEHEPSYNAHVPGQNVRVLPSVARRPEYSAWFKAHKALEQEKQAESVPQNHHSVYHHVQPFLPTTEKTYYEHHAAPEKTVVFAVVPKQYKQHPHMYKHIEPAKEGATRPPVVYFNVAKTKAYSYPYSHQKPTFPHYQHEASPLHYRLNEQKQVPVNYVYVAKPQKHYASEHH